MIKTKIILQKKTVFFTFAVGGAFQKSFKGREMSSIINSISIKNTIQLRELYLK